MKKTIILILVCMFCSICAQLYADDVRQKILDNQSRIEELEERIDSVERSTLIDRVKLSMDVRITLNNYIYRERSLKENLNLGLLRDDGETWGAWNMRGRLKLRADLGASLKFTGWLTMYKQFIESAPGRYTSGEVAPTYDMSRGQYPGDSTVYFERMYVDWFITKWLALTVGRVPSTNGPGSDVRYDSVELSSFPENLISAPVDGVYLSFDLQELLGLDKSYLKIWYVPRLYLSEIIPNNLFVGAETPNLNYGGIEFDMLIPGTTDTTIMANLTFTPEITMGESKVDIDGDGVEEVLHPMADGSRFLSWNLFLKSLSPLNLPFEVFAAFGGSAMFTGARTDSAKGSGFIGAPTDPHTGLSTPLASFLGSDLSGDVLTGFTAYAGMRWNTPLKIADSSLKIGADFNYASRYYFMYYAPDTTGLNRFGIRGYHGEGYIIIPIHRKANVRLCYIYEHHNYPWFLVGAVGAGVPEIDETIHNFNMMLNVSF